MPESKQAVLSLRTSSAARTALAIAPGVLLAGVAGGIAFPILPIVGVHAGLPLALIGVILAANRATRVFASPVVGVLADRVGGRRTLLVGLVLQVAVMALYTLGITTGKPGLFFLLGRVLHGLGSACVFVAAQALALHAGGDGESGSAAGTVRAAMALGVPVGLVAGGLVSDWLGNTATFGMATAAVIVATILAAALVPDLRVRVEVGASLRASLRALSDRRMFAIGWLNLVVSFSVMGMVLTTLGLIVHEQRMMLLGFGAEGSSGLLMGCMTVSSAIAMPVAGRLGDRLHAHAPIAAGGIAILALALGAVGFARGATELIAGLVVIGIGAGALGPSLLALVGEVVPQERRGMAVGLLQLCSDIGGAVGPLVGTALIAGSVQVPYLVTAALVACAFPVALWLARHPADPARIARAAAPPA